MNYKKIIFIILIAVIFLSGGILAWQYFSPFINLFFPTGGEKLIAGNLYDITWQSNNYEGKVNIFLIDHRITECEDNEECRWLTVRGGGAIGTIIARNVLATAERYSWTIPIDINPGDSTFLIWIEGEVGFAPWDVSHDYFSIARLGEELGIRERWLRILDYHADVNNDGIDEFFIVEKSLKESTSSLPDPGMRAYDVVAFFEDEEKLVELWRRQVILWKEPIETIGVSVGDLDGDGINEVLIIIAGGPGHNGSGELFEYSKDEPGFKLSEHEFIERIGRIMDRKIKDIENFRFWDFKGIGDYNGDGIDEVLIRYHWIDEVTAGVGAIIPISWQEILREKEY